MSNVEAQIPVSSASHEVAPAQDIQSSDEPCFAVKFGHKLRYLRNTSGMSQEKLAEKAGISVKMLQRYEHGKSGHSDGHANPRLDTLLALASAFDIDISELLTISYDAQIDIDLGAAEEKWIDQATSFSTKR